jgi:uncharacterized delta-60 repeat protein
MSRFRRFIRIMLPLMLVALWVPILAAPAHAAPGDLDPSFSGDGIVTTPVGTGDDQVNGVRVQSDGKIVVAGTTDNGFAAPDDFALVRYTSSGALDSSFGSGGKVVTSISSSEDRGQAVAIHTDGKIVVAGHSLIGGDWDFALTRYTTAGVLDGSFGSGGKVTTHFGGVADDFVYGLAIQGDGKIVAAGSSNAGGTDAFALARYTTSGTLDGSFGSGGKVTTAFSAYGEQARSVILQPDEKIVAVGFADNGIDADFALARYTSSGALDATFGPTGDGTAATSIGPADDFANSVDLQPDGRIVVAGLSTASSGNEFALARYTAAGSLDGSFGTAGTVTLKMSSLDRGASAVAVQTDGRIVVAGTTCPGSVCDFAVLRYTASGALDGSFGSGGKVTTHITTDDTAKAMDIQPDGRIVVGGQTYTGSTYDFAVARYLARLPVVSIGDAFVVEENAESVLMNFPVSLAGAGASDSVTVDFQTVADSAGSKDFGATTGTVTFDPGQTTGTISVSVKGDSIYEENETFFVKLSSPVGATLGDSLGEGTIVDNDGVPDMSISSPSVTEGNSGTTGMVYTLSLTNPSSEYISVDFSTADGTATAPADYQSASGTRWFKPGQVTRTITVYVKGETVQEPNETVLVNLSDANGAGIETGQGVGTIIDDDRPTISINDAQVTEGTSGTTKTMTFTVTLSKAGTSSITVQYATANDTAVAPGDYTAKAGTLTFTVGQVSKPITVTIKGDNIAECTESFFVNLSNPTNTSIADGQGVGTIVTDEPSPCD